MRVAILIHILLTSILTAGAIDQPQLLCPSQKLDGRLDSRGVDLCSNLENSDNFRMELRALGRGDHRTSLPGGAVDPAVNGVWMRSRGGVVEEYRTLIEGIRHDIVLWERQRGTGDVVAEIEFSGCRVRKESGKMRLELPSGRRLSYHRLKVTDNREKLLGATMEWLDEQRVAIIVDDKAAVYPLRIDPTISGYDYEMIGGRVGFVGGIRALVIENGAPVVGGWFEVINGNAGMNRTGLIKWNGTAFYGANLFDSVSAICPPSSGTAQVPCLAGEDGIYTPGGTILGTLNEGGTVFSICEGPSSELLVGGNFTTVAGVSVNNIARWNGVFWSGLADGMNGEVRAIIKDLSGNVFAGGEFTTAGGAACSNIALWNGTLWSPMGAGINGKVWTLLIDENGDLLAGGEFTTAGGVACSNLARWDGTNWSAVGAGVSGRVRALAIDENDDLLVGGSFTLAGGAVACSNVARWDGAAWHTLGSGTDGEIQHLGIGSGNRLWAAGEFYQAGGLNCDMLAYWDGANWGVTHTSAGLNNEVLALVTSASGDLYAGGKFVYAGATRYNHVARWNGVAWQTLGVGVNGVVRALTVDSLGQVYAGGDFSEAGGAGANHIARWTGSAWQPLGSGVDNIVRALAVDGSDNLFAAGDFLQAGGAPANRIACWNGAWTTLGDGLNDVGHALLHDGSTLYAGGAFTTAGGVATARVARWNGTNWSAMGDGFNDNVYAFALHGSRPLCAGGSFTQSGATPLSLLAAWNGANWYSLNIPIWYGSPRYISSLAYEAEGDLFISGRIRGFSLSDEGNQHDFRIYDGENYIYFGTDLYGGAAMTPASGRGVFIGGKYLPNGSTTVTKWVPITTPPTVSLYGWDYGDHFNVSIYFSKKVIGLTLNDFVVRNGTASNLTMVSYPCRYEMTVVKTQSGALTVQLPAKRVVDEDGQPNSASNLLTLIPGDSKPTYVSSGGGGSCGVTGPIDQGWLIVLLLTLVLAVRHQTAVRRLS